MTTPQLSRRTVLGALGASALLPALLPALTRAADTATATADAWPEFRGPTAMGLSSAKAVPTQWSADQHLAWKSPLPGQGWSSPVVASGKVFLTAAVRDKGVSLGAACLDLATGKVLWDTPVFQPPAQQVAVMHRKNTLASPTPVVTADRLFVHFGHMGSAALDLAGKIVWKQSDLAYPPTHGNGSSPVLAAGGVVFSADAQSDPFLASLDQATGKVKWKTARRGGAAKSKFSFATPLLVTVGDRQQLISPASGYVAAYDPATGAEIWRVEYGAGYSVVPRPAFAHGLVFACSGFDRATLYAIKADGAKGDVTGSHVAWRLTKNAPLTPSPLVVGDELYVVSDNGFATCCDARTGAVHWSQRLGGNFSTSPVAAAGHVYFQSEQGVGHVVKAAKTFTPVAENDLKERTLASYAVIEGGLLIRTESGLVRVKA